MNTKKIIITFFTAVYLLLSTAIIFFQYSEMNNNFDENSKNILYTIVNELDKPDKLQNITNSLPKNYFFALWVKKDNSKWLPIIYDEKILSKNLLTNPNVIPDVIKVNTKIFYYKNNKYESNLWVNKFNINFYGKYLFILILFLFLVYFLILFFITLFFKKSVYASEKNISENIINIKKNGLSENISEYKTLWEKNFKISDNFKNNFQFSEISDLIKLGTKPEKYIKDALFISSKYFKWINPKMFITQKNDFIEILSKESLSTSEINIPLNGKQKGKFFIPLFPYNTNSIYGYFSFEWQNEDSFYLSDILFFLKFIFSENAKFIFLNYSEIENIINVLNKKLEKHDQILIALIEADDKEKINTSINHNDIEKLNNKILNNINELFVSDLIYPVSNFLYLIIGINFDKDKKIQEIENWLKNPDNQHYKVSSLYGDIALTFSAGLSFKDSRNIEPLFFLNEAENKLKKALVSGGNRLIL